MDAWAELSEAERREVWDCFYAQFQFCLNFHERQVPAILEPTPSVVIDLSAKFEDAVVEELNNVFLESWRVLAVRGHEKLYALDWQHTCYWFFPLHEPRPWRLSVYPDGDYYAFLATDFSFGTFGHPWQQSLCVFGEPLLTILPDDFWKTARILRRSGG